MSATPTLQGQVAAVTGAASGIGFASELTDPRSIIDQHVLLHISGKRIISQIGLAAAMGGKVRQAAIF